MTLQQNKHPSKEDITQEEVSLQFSYSPALSALWAQQAIEDPSDFLTGEQVANHARERSSKMQSLFLQLTATSLASA